MTHRSSLSPAILVALFVIAGCGAADAPAIQDDGLTIQNPHDGLWQDREEVPIRFELEQTFGAEEEPEEAILGGIQSPVVDDAGNVYLYDPGADRIASFDASGELRWTTGRAGQGPGEFQQMSGMAWDGGHRLYVLNQSGNRLETYDLDGNHLKSMQVGLEDVPFPSLVGFILPDLFVLRGMLPGRVGAEIVVARLAESWQVLGRVVDDQSGELPDLGGISASPNATIIGDRVSIGHLQEYRIAIFDTAGSLVRVIERDMHDIVRPGVYSSGGGSSMSLFGGLSAPLRLSSGHLLTTVSWPLDVSDPDEVVRQRIDSNQPPELKNVHALDLYDADGRLLYTLMGESSTPEIGRPVWADDAGRLYTVVYEPYPQLRRYRVVIDE